MQWFAGAILFILLVSSIRLRAQGRVDQTFMPWHSVDASAPSVDQHPVQSFVPDLSAIGFVTLYVGNTSVPNNGIGATISILLRSGNFDGPVLNSTAPVVVGPVFHGLKTFLFPANVPINPGQEYYLEVASTGPADGWRVAWSGYPGENPTYSNGTAYINGKAMAWDIGFSEGVVIPEPATISLFAVGTMFWIGVWVRRRHLSASKG